MRRITTLIVLASLGLTLVGIPASAAPGGVPGAPADAPKPPSEPGRPPEPGSGTPGTPVEVSIADTTIVEGATAQVDVTLSAASANDTTLDWATSDDTATAGEDYVGGAGTLTIPAGAVTGTIEIATIDDDAVEDDEVFIVTLSNPSANATLADATATVTILDDDEELPHAIFDPRQDNVTEGELAVLGLALSHPSNQDVTLHWSINDQSSAIAGEDYVVPASTTTVIPAGETTATIQIQTIDDEVAEEQEDIILNLEDADGATIGVGNSAIILIADNDEPQGDCLDDGLEPTNDTRLGATPHDSTEFGVASTLCPHDIDWWQTGVGADELVEITIVGDGDTHLAGTVVHAEFWADGATDPVEVPGCGTGDLEGCVAGHDSTGDGNIDRYVIQFANESPVPGVLFYSIELPSDEPVTGYDYHLEPIQRHSSAG